MSRVESGERISAGQPEPRAASASRRRSHPPRPPRRLPPSTPSPRPCPAGGQLAPLTVFAEPRGHRSAPPLHWAAHRLCTPLLLLPQPGAWHRGPLPDARGPAPLFAPRLLLPVSSSPNFSNSLAPLTSPRLRSSRSAPATFRPVPKVGARPSCPHHGTVRLARPSLHPGRAQRRAPGCGAQVEKLLGSAASLRVKRLQQERCPYA